MFRFAKYQIISAILIFQNICKRILTNAPEAVFAAIEVELLLLVDEAGRPIGHHWFPFNMWTAQCTMYNVHCTLLQLYNVHCYYSFTCLLLFHTAKNEVKQTWSAEADKGQDFSSVKGGRPHRHLISFLFLKFFSPSMSKYMSKKPSRFLKHLPCFLWKQE